MIKKVTKFFSEVVVELKKVSWSSRQELKDSTWMVFVSATFLAVFIWAIDLGLSRIIGFIIQ